MTEVHAHGVDHQVVLAGDRHRLVELLGVDAELGRPLRGVDAELELVVGRASGRHEDARGARPRVEPQADAAPRRQASHASQLREQVDVELERVHQDGLQVAVDQVRAGVAELLCRASRARGPRRPHPASRRRRPRRPACPARRGGAARQAPRARAAPSGQSAPGRAGRWPRAPPERAARGRSTSVRSKANSGVPCSRARRSASRPAIRRRPSCTSRPGRTHQVGAAAGTSDVAVCVADAGRSSLELMAPS